MIIINPPKMTEYIYASFSINIANRYTAIEIIKPKTTNIGFILNC